MEDSLLLRTLAYRVALNSKFGMRLPLNKDRLFVPQHLSGVATDTANESLSHAPHSPHGGARIISLELTHAKWQQTQN